MAEVEFSPVDNELPLRWFRRLHLVPANGIGAGRRAVFFALLTWLPIAAWSFVAGRFLTADAGEPLLQHFGVHVRCLLAIPLFILAEASLHDAAQHIVGQFRSSGAVSPELRDRFDSAIAAVRRLRDASLPWVFVFGAAVAWSVVDQPAVRDDTMSWAVGADGSLGFGGLWFSYVVRPIFLALLLGWLWRMLLVSWWFWKVGRLGLALVPTHPDRTGGIAFVEKVPGAFAMVTFATTAVIASRWAHDIEFHAATLQSFKVPGGCVRNSVDAACAAAAAGARSRADRGARPRNSCVRGTRRRAGATGSPALDSARNGSRHASPRRAGDRARRGRQRDVRRGQEDAGRADRQRRDHEGALAHRASVHRRCGTAGSVEGSVAQTRQGIGVSVLFE